MMTNIQNNLAQVDNILRFNALIIELGDKLLTGGLAAPGASAVPLRPHAQGSHRLPGRAAGEHRAPHRCQHREIPRQQGPRLSRGQPEPAGTPPGRHARRWTTCEKAPNFEPSLLFRMARAYQDTGRQWEAILVNRRLIDKLPGRPGTRACLLQHDCLSGRHRSEQEGARSLRGLPESLSPGHQRRRRRPTCAARWRWTPAITRRRSRISARRCASVRRGSSTTG